MILANIIFHKQKEIANKKKVVSLEQLISFCKKDRQLKRDFKIAIAKNQQAISLIAEIKLASPSGGKFADETDIEKKVLEYEQGEAEAISVVVDKKFFQGDLTFIKRIKKASTLPILVKDFILDPYQLYELKKYGADAVLLIAKIISPQKLKQLVELSFSLDMEPVVEVQTVEELKTALSTQVTCIGVNARNLTDFAVDIEQACRIIRRIPKEKIVIGFSGIKTFQDVQKYKQARATAVLVGTSLMKSNHAQALIHDLKRNIPLVKICGIRTLEVAQASIRSGADFLGFNFVPTSKRYISPKKATAIISRLPKSTKKVGIFQDETLETVLRIIKELKLDFVQLHGKETSEYCQKIPVGVIKTFSVFADFDVTILKEKMKQYAVDFYLLDRKVQGAGDSLKLEKVALLTHEFPIMLAGGLTSFTVGKAVRIIQPFGVDVASGVEMNGKQNSQTISKFIKEAKSSFARASKDEGSHL